MTNHRFLGEQTTMDPLEIKEISDMNQGKFLWTQIGYGSLGRTCLRHVGLLFLTEIYFRLSSPC
jgi:hypothetical protein